jgi:hypothetical protein
LSLGLGEGGLLVPGLVLPGLVLPGLVLPGLVLPGLVLPGLGSMGELVPPGAGLLGLGVESVPPLGADELPDPGPVCARTMVRPSNEKKAGFAGAAAATRTSAAGSVVSVAWIMAG